MVLVNLGHRRPPQGDAVAVRGFFLAPIRSLAALSLGLSVAALGGCGMSSLTSGIGGGMFGGGSSQSTEVSSVSEDQLLAAAKSSDPNATSSTTVGEVEAGCPRFTVAPHDNYITFYQQGHVGDGLSVTQRGEITKTARECQVEPGRVVVKYGFSGRVLLGPKGQAGNITLPVTVKVTDSKREQIASDSVKVDVNVGLDKPIAYFSAVHTVTFPIPEGSRPGEFELVVGFDSKAAGSG
jgi:hypothetical protein